MRTILLIEDIPEVALWLQQRVIQVFPDARCTLASTLQQALTCAQQAFDLALIDLGLPDGDGTQALRHIKLHHPDTYCIVTTIFDDANHLFTALRAGADGYLLKDDEENAFASALQGILAGRPPLSASIARMMLAQFQVQQPEVPLSPRENDILVLIANGYSVRKAAESLGISTHTAASYLKNLYQKLQVSNRAELTLKAVNMGLINPNNKL